MPSHSQEFAASKWAIPHFPSAFFSAQVEAWLAADVNHASERWQRAQSKTPKAEFQVNGATQIVAYGLVEFERDPDRARGEYELLRMRARAKGAPQEISKINFKVIADDVVPVQRGQTPAEFVDVLATITRCGQLPYVLSAGIPHAESDYRDAMLREKERRFYALKARDSVTAVSERLIHASGPLNTGLTTRARVSSPDEWLENLQRFRAELRMSAKTLYALLGAIIASKNFNVDTGRLEHLKTLDRDFARESGVTRHPKHELALPPGVTKTAKELGMPTRYLLDLAARELVQLAQLDPTRFRFTT